jgi:hypothetical protein
VTIREAPASPVSHDDGVSYERPYVREWYANGPAGLEQGFTLSHRLSGIGAVTLVVGRVAPGTAAALNHDRSAVSMRRGTSASIVTYGALSIRDARGRQLRGRLVIAARHILIRFDDRGARYPIAVDPLVEQAELTAVDVTRGTGFGPSIAVSNGTLVVGAPHQQVGSTSQEGAAYVFTKSSGQWEQTAELTAADGAAGDQFGGAVAISGTTIAVAAPGKFTNPYSGAVYVFTQGPDGWQQSAELFDTNDSGVASDFGASIVLTGTTLVVGAPARSPGGQTYVGAAYVFNESAGRWTQSAELTAADGDAGDFFGQSLSISGNLLAVGAPGGQSDPGAVYLFSDETGTWQQTAKLVAADGTNLSSFGESEAVAGSTLVIGSPGRQVGSNNYQGVIYVFTQSAGAWQPTAELSVSDGGYDSELGQSVALSGSTILAGAPRTTFGANPVQGTAYVFTNGPGGWEQTSELSAVDGNTYEYFGQAVAMDSGSVFIAAPEHQVGSLNQTGAVYTFDDTATPVPVTTGPPTISGTASIGNTLTANPGSWASSPTSYAYQWLDCDTDGGNCSEIAGATDQTYTLVTADVGHTVEVLETATNINGPSSQARSLATGVVAGAPPVNSQPPTISGPPNEASTLVEAHGAWSPTPTAYFYQWERCGTSGSGCYDIPGATAQSYVLTSADVGQTIRVRETASNAGTLGTPAESAATPVIQQPLPPSEVSPPTISGIAEQGQTLSESHGSWANNPISFVYQWEDCPSGGGNCTDIPGATNQTYTLASSDVTHTIRVVETASNTSGPGSAASSAPTAVVVVPAAPASVNPPTIFGTATAGSSLLEAHGTWSNHPLSYTYEWERCNTQGDGCGAIAGATSQSYQLSGWDVGSTIRVVETATNAGGSGTAVSSPTAAVIASVPVNTGQPGISGQATVGSVLLESPGSWAGSPTTFGYQWLACDSSGGTCVPIPGATSQFYTISSSDAGQTIRVQETASNGDGAGAPAVSLQTAIVEPPGPSELVPPAISGSPTVGQTLQASHGTWTNAPVAFGYQWEDCDAQGLNCVSIQGAGDQTYVVGTADVGHAIEVQVTAVNGSGASSPANSAPTGIVTGPPVVGGSGQPVVNADGTVAVSGIVDPEGLSTSVHFEYGFAPQYAGSTRVLYSWSSRTAIIGRSPLGFFAISPVKYVLKGLNPNTIYHVHLVATNDAGTAIGPDQIFRTKASTGPVTPTIGQAVVLSPVSGVVLFRDPTGGIAPSLSFARDATVIGPGFAPLTQARQLTNGTEVDARRGRLRLIAAASNKRVSRGTVSGGIFTVNQAARGTSKGVTTLTLVFGAFSGAPSFGDCRGASSAKVVESLQATAGPGAYRTVGRGVSVSGRGARWLLSARCGGTSVKVTHGMVTVLTSSSSAAVHAGQTRFFKRGD